MNFLLQNKFSSRSKSRFPKSFLIMGVLVLIIVGINQLTFGGVSRVLYSAGGPIWKSQAGVVNAFESILVGFKNKQELQKDNERLREEVARLELSYITTEILRQENEDLRGFLNREVQRELIVAAVLARPNRTLYDTFVVDVGRRDGVTKGARVFGLGEVVIGTVEEVYSRMSLISLYSTPGRSTEVFLGSGSVVAEAIGRGGGNFEIRIPRGIEVLKGHAISSSDMSGGIFGVIEEIIALPSDSFQTIFFSSPVNIQSLRTVTILLR